MKKPSVIEIRSLEKPLESIVRTTTHKRALLLAQELVFSHLDQRGADSADSRQKDTAALKKIVPAQKKLAPATFDIVDGKLVIADTSSTASLLNQGSAKAARDLLIENGSRLLEQLASSNFDKRIVENIQHMQERLVSATNVIQLGMLNIGCGLLVGALANELPDSLAAAIKTHHIGINMYVSQFPDWKRFISEAIDTQLSDTDIASISNIAGEVVQELSAASNVVDPKVPATINAIKQFLKSPGESGKKAAYAIMATIENLVSVIFGRGISLIDQTTTKTIDKTSTALSTAAAGILLAIALNVATSIGPISIKMPEVSWISRAAEILQRHLGQSDKD